ncbi:hypothetical protein VP06_05465 [Methylobacterium aquaticum]|uniref:Uncharacterized protein n=1 Tax=Methylobacterium aquaticum TaxID=270351 RepID=A0A0J6SUA3_9HYPH|nr:hypothetical protein VP06_05465 [Methylobacterium aquaticum]
MPHDTISLTTLRPVEAGRRQLGDSLFGIQAINLLSQPVRLLLDDCAGTSLLLCPDERCLLLPHLLGQPFAVDGRLSFGRFLPPSLLRMYSVSSGTCGDTVSLLLALLLVAGALLAGKLAGLLLTFKPREFSRASARRFILFRDLGIVGFGMRL